ncbi:PKD domain-containing protein [Lacibacter sediminis]|uniref:PD40 domain-containing protein n=1 Tax=Lacibacter sediminis TaxID=2760713 RepID=A0A7G5XLH5_9BACT|nr:PD40 domain-containing protein [Lacibacter sediminis]QNA46328.1 PD40 domain-containing protein [Lacibacter sediminis]
MSNAGPDKTIYLPNDSTILNGRNSVDPDGYIISWLWTKISGPGTPVIMQATDSICKVKKLAAGLHQFELKVTDNGSLWSNDTINIKVIDTATGTTTTNRPPIARAGQDQTIVLPLNSVTLDGSASTDPDNNIRTYLWRKISGPPLYNIQNANASKSLFSNLELGVYLLELTVTDSAALNSTDTIQVEVVNPLPPCTDCKVVFVSKRDGNPEIYKCNADGSNIIRLTNNAATDDHPVWSPDGKLIAFVSDRSGYSELYIMQADGSNVVQKTFLSRFCENPTWSPDGSKIAFASFHNGSMNIWMLDVASGATPLIFEAPGWDSQPSWSPDGLKIAISSDWAAYDLDYDLYYISIQNNNLPTFPVTSNLFDTLNYFHPSWSPDGRKLACAIVKTTGINSYSTQIGTMNFWGTEITTIATGASPFTKTSWSPDGYRIAYTSLASPGAPPNISWVAANGSSSGIIVTNGWNADW